MIGRQERRAARIDLVVHALEINVHEHPISSLVSK